jgi:hypothetical protein
VFRSLAVPSVSIALDSSKVVLVGSFVVEFGNIMVAVFFATFPFTIVS